MFEQEEKELNNYKQKIDEQPLPPGLDDAIRSGIIKAKRAKNKRNYLKWSTLAAGILLVVLLTSVRVSPTVASFVSQFPGMKGIVELIHYDKGLSDAVENDYIVELNVSDVKNGLGFTIDGMIIDETQMILFYTIENFTNNIDYVTMNNIKLIAEDGRTGLNAGISYGGFHRDLLDKGSSQGKINVSFSEETIIPETLTVSVGFDIKDGTGKKLSLPNQEWTVSFDIDHSTFIGLKKEFVLNETVSFADQQVTFNKVVIYPTRMVIDVNIFEQNTMQLFHFDDLKITNEKGEEWFATTNGVIASKISDYEWKLYLESNYFHEAKELYLEASSIRAVRKEEVEVIIDINQKTIINGPVGLTVHSLESNSNNHNVELLLKTDKELDNNRHFSITSHEMTNEHGDKYEVADGVGSSRTEGEGDEKIFFSINNFVGDYLHLTLSDYPARIKDEMKIELLR